mmetsp:Transcript_22351/g.53013  ORF Transcript_22351/g.53013 Transcript_22351/m.53013 type:complete len:204 (+) Transcript_22351:602-1213(+)
MPYCTPWLAPTLRKPGGRQIWTQDPVSSILKASCSLSSGHGFSKLAGCVPLTHVSEPVPHSLTCFVRTEEQASTSRVAYRARSSACPRSTPREPRVPSAEPPPKPTDPDWPGLRSGPFASMSAASNSPAHTATPTSSCAAGGRSAHRQRLSPGRRRLVSLETPASSAPSGIMSPAPAYQRAPELSSVGELAAVMNCCSDMRWE